MKKRNFPAPSSASILIRSNYRQREVALQIVLERHFSGSCDPPQVVGRVELELLNEKGQAALGERKTHSQQFEQQLRFEFETAEVQQRERLHTDSLPDVLICDQRWVGMLAVYRQLVCERLATDGDVVFADRPTWVVDPVIGTLPALLDTDPEAVELFLSLLQKYEVLNRDLSPCEAVRRFRFTHLQFMVPLLAMADSSGWRKQLAAFAQGKSSEEPDPIKAMASPASCRMLDPFEYAVDLCGKHAID